MKRIFLFLAFATAVFAQNAAHGPITKSTSGATKNNIDEDLNVGSGRALTVAAGGTLTGNGSIAGTHLQPLGTGDSPTFAGLTLTSPLSVPNGGNGLTTATLGDIRYGSGTNTLAALPGSTSTTLAVLTQTGTGTGSAAPAWLSTIGTGNIVRAISPTLTGLPVVGGVTFNGNAATSLNSITADSTHDAVITGGNSGGQLILRQGSGGTNGGNFFTASRDGSVVVAQNLQASSYSEFMAKSQDSPQFADGKGTSMGWFNGTDDVAYSRGYIEAFDLTSATLPVLNLMQSSSSGRFLRQRFLSDGTIVFYRADAVYPGQTAVFTIGPTGGTTTHGASTTDGGLFITGNTGLPTSFTAAGILYSNPNTDILFGDGTGYHLRAIKRSSGVTTALLDLDDSGNLQLPLGYLKYGSDTTLFRGGAGNLYINSIGGTNPALGLQENGSTKFILQTSSGTVTMTGTAATQMVFQTNGGNSWILDASHNGNLIGNLTVSGTGTNIFAGSISAANLTDLVMAGGSGGASLDLAQGTNANISLTPSGPATGNTGGKTTSTHRFYIGSGSFSENGIVGNGYIQSRVLNENNQLRLVQQISDGGSYRNWIAFDLARGPYGAPTAPLIGDIFGSIVSVANFTGGGHAAEIDSVATENFSSSAYGSAWKVYSVANATTTQTLNLSIGDGGMNRVYIPNQLLVGSNTQDNTNVLRVHSVVGTTSIVAINDGIDTTQLHLGTFSNDAYLFNNYFYASGHLSDDATLGSSGIILGNNRQITFQTAAASATPSRVTLLTLDGSSSLATLSGNLTVSGMISTGAPTVGTAAAWKLGSIVTGTSLTTSTTQGLRLNVAGTDYTLAVLTTNP